MIGAAGPAVLGDPTEAAQFQINNGQLEQLLPDGTILYANVQPPANSSVVKLAMSFATTPDTLGTFVWGGDTVEWSSPTVTRPQTNVSRLTFTFASSRLSYRITGMAGLPGCGWKQARLHQPWTI